LDSFELALRDSIADCSSKFHQLLYVAGYWNSNTHLYIEPASRLALPESRADAVRRLHALVFHEWIQLPLAHQFAEFRSYLLTFRPEERRTLLRLLESEEARAAIPPACPPEARDLFLSDLAMVIRMSTVPACADDYCTLRGG
jgi:pentose-5-phosphate-3-epimerase